MAVARRGAKTYLFSGRNGRLSRNLTTVSTTAHDFVRTPRAGLGHTAGMKTTVTNPQKAFALIALVLAFAAMAIYVADADDAPRLLTLND